MRTNPDAASILCYGDSNTFGVPSEPDNYQRVPADHRWTGVLQHLLGDEYDVIEEGLPGRTTDVEYDDRPGCNGRPYFTPCLLSHQPLEVVVIMLGTNDLKNCFGRTARDIAEALHGYVDDVPLNAATRVGEMPSILLVSPIWIDDSLPTFVEVTEGNFDETAAARSRELSSEIQRVAKARHVAFADAATVGRAGADGLHLTPSSHRPLAELLADEISQLLARP